MARRSNVSRIDLYFCIPTMEVGHGFLLITLDVLRKLQTCKCNLETFTMILNTRSLSEGSGPQRVLVLP